MLVESAFHFLIFALKVCKEVWDLYSHDKFAHKKGDTYNTVSRPYLSIFFVLFDRAWKFRILCTFSWKRKGEFIIGGAMLLTILYISITSVCKFSLYVVIMSWKSLSWSYGKIYSRTRLTSYELRLTSC